MDKRQLETEKLIEKLRSDPVRNSSIIGFIKNNSISLILEEGNSVLVKGKSDHDWIYISSKDKNELIKLLLKLNFKEIYFASLEDWMVLIITAERNVEWKLTTCRYFLPDSFVVPENRIEASNLSENDADYVWENSNYKQFLDVEYLKQRIGISLSAGIFVENKLAAWAITHDDGAIGALHVLDEFRKKGYASEVVINLVHKIRNIGMIPIAQIEEKNKPAIRLFEKLGFVKDRNVTWLKLL